MDWEVVLGRSSEEEWRVTSGGRKATELVPIVGCGAPLYGAPSEKLCGHTSGSFHQGLVWRAGLRCVSIDNLHPSTPERTAGLWGRGHECPALPICALLWNPIGAGKALWQWRRETHVFEMDSCEPAGNCTGEFWLAEGNGQDIWKGCHRGQPDHKKYVNLVLY